jgi:hypothetical protein
MDKKNEIVLVSDLQRWRMINVTNLLSSTQYMRPDHATTAAHIQQQKQKQKPPKT